MNMVSVIRLEPARFAVRYAIGAAVAVLSLIFFELLWPEFVVMSALSGGLFISLHKKVGDRWLVAIPVCLSLFVALVFSTRFAFAPVIAWVALIATEEVLQRLLPYVDER
jgi:hypothetical protein